jgi:hypothetical protein
MSYRVAINGFGRIGRNYLRCVLERGLLDRGVRVVAVNDLWDPGTLAHLLEHDTTFGKRHWDVAHDDAGADGLPGRRRRPRLVRHDAGRRRTALVKVLAATTSGYTNRPPT